MDLWTELQHVRRQFGEYKDQTERELENQRNEFARISRGVGGFARQLNLSSYEVNFLIQNLTLIFEDFNLSF